AAAAQSGGSTLTFKDVPHGMDETHHVAAGYRADVVVRWGDPLFAGTPAYEAGKADPAVAERQFGYNCDFLAFWPVPFGSRSSTRGLICANHEYTNAELMFPGITERGGGGKLSKEQIEVEMSAHGLSVVEVRKEGGRWKYVPDSPFNRRFTARTTEFRV